MSGTRALLVLLVLAAGFVRPARGHFVERTDSLWGFVSRSELVALGRVVESRRVEQRRHTTLPGLLRIRVEESLRGEVAGETDIVLEGVHQPRYSPGERVLVFSRREGTVFRSLQSRNEKISLDSAEPGVLDAIRRYTAIAGITEPAERCRALARITLELLRSPVPRLHQDAVFDLSRPGLLDSCLGPERLQALAGLALDEKAPLVVREGIAAKLGALARGGRLDAGHLLSRLVSEPKNPAVRVAAVNALRRSSRPEAAAILVAALDDENAWVRLAAVEALRGLRVPEAFEALERAAWDRDRRVAFAARRALKKPK
jgi:hypothetical protein